MSTKRPDVIRKPPSPEEALTLAEIHVAGWIVRANCTRCGLAVRVSMGVMVATYGPDAVLWGRQPRCPRWDPCDGRMTYSAASIKGGSWRSLRSPAPQRCLDLWKAKRAQWLREPR